MEKESQDLPGGKTFCKRDVDFIQQNFNKGNFGKPFLKRYLKILVQFERNFPEIFKVFVKHFGRKRLDCVQFKTC